MKKFSKKPIVAIIAASALSMSLAVPAFASTASTSVTLQTNDAQLSVTAPSSIPLGMKGDGTFIAPAPASTKITNNSVMPVAVKNAQMQNVLSGTTLVSTIGASPAVNSWKMTVNSMALTTANAATSGTAWNLKPTGVSGNALQLTAAGQMANVDGSVDFSAAKTLGSIQWTFGSALNK